MSRFAQPSVPPLSPPLPLPTLIGCIEERIAVVRTVGRGTVSLGCVAELLEHALPYLRELATKDECRAS